LKRLISSFKDPSSATNKTNEERENEGKRWGALGSSLWKKRKKHTHTHTHIDFLGQKFGQTKRNHSGLGIFF
jgi:hypothetical protein